MSFIFSDDGEIWRRTPTLGINESSEAQLTELSDGTIRAFFRNWKSRICWADAKYDGENYVWSEIVVSGSELFGRASNCQIAALRLKDSYEECDVLLAACPANPDHRTDSGRYGGMLHTFLYDPKSGQTRLRKTTPINAGSDFYGYSCLTQLQDGRIALLYESESDFNFSWKIFPLSLIL